MSSLRNTTVRVRGNCRQSRNNSRNRTDVNRRKSGKVHAIFAEFRWTIRVVWSSPTVFLTSATCHLFEKRWRESMITAFTISRGACRQRLHFAISQENPHFCTFISPSIFHSNISHFALYQHPPSDGTARRTSS